MDAKIKLNRWSVLSWLISGLVVFTTGLSAFIHLKEWYQISVLGNVAGYPFGGEGPTPYYYKTPELYANVSLIWGLVFSGVFIFALVSTINRRKSGLIAGFVITVFLLAALVVHGMIE